jgi:hypothetical protein
VTKRLYWCGKSEAHSRGSGSDAEALEPRSRLPETLRQRPMLEPSQSRRRPEILILIAPSSVPGLTPPIGGAGDAGAAVTT